MIINTIGQQTTISKKVTVSGRGLHTGKQVSLSFLPAPINYGIQFKRIDLPGEPNIHANINNVFDISRGTFIRENNAEVKTVEHVMAALAGCEIDNILIEINAEETPILDGSAKLFVEALLEAGLSKQNAQRTYLKIEKPIEFNLPDKGIFLSIKPADSFSMKVFVDYGTQVLASQEAFLPSMSQFIPYFYNSRTFVFLHELQYLIQNNLVKGGDIDNAIVFVDKMPEQGVLDQLAKFFNRKDINISENNTLDNIKLHYENEPARHKLLDLVGDLYLIGMPVIGEITAYKSGHFANTQFAHRIYEELLLNK